MAKILARQGFTRFMLDAGRGDAAGAVDVPLAVIYDAAQDKIVTPNPWPVASLAARGYWDPADDLPEVFRDDIVAKAAAAG